MERGVNMKDTMLYLDRFICFEEIVLDSAEDYAQCNNWNAPYMNNANTIFVCTEGQWTVLIEGASYTMRLHDLCISKCMEACLMQPERYPSGMWRISFSPYYFRVIDPQLRLCRPFHAREMGVGNLIAREQYDETQFFRHMLRVTEERDGMDKRLALVVSLAGFLYELGQSYNYHQPDTRPEEIRTILDYIDAHYCEDIELETLSKNLYLSRSQLAKVMKRATGFTTWDYVLNKRIYRALQMLHNGMGNREVAKAVGFRDYSTFYKAFLKISNTTPNNEHPTEQIDPLLQHFYNQEEASDWMQAVFAKRFGAGTAEIR